MKKKEFVKVTRTVNLEKSSYDSFKSWCKEIKYPFDKYVRDLIRKELELNRIEYTPYSEE